MVIVIDTVTIFLNLEFVQIFMIERKSTNFILHFVKKPRRYSGIACVFCLVQNEICLLQPVDGILNKLLDTLFVFLD